MDEEKTGETKGHGSILDAVLHQQNIHTQDLAIGQRLQQLFGILPERDRKIIESHFGLFEVPFATLEEIGKNFSITRERVRQIERSSIATLRKSNEYQKLIRPFEDTVVQILEECGGAMQEEQLFREVFGDDSDDMRHVVQFLFSELFGRVERLQAGKLTQDGWRLKLSSWEFIEQTLQAFEEVVRGINRTTSEEELMSVIEHSVYFQQHADQLTRRAILSLLGLSAVIRHNPFGLWGLSSWSEIIPKRMSDKIYLAMKKRGSPMHFREIARAINEMKLDRKVAHPATIHNELIINAKYVLIGRGIYALAEWGYEPGVVADVIADILKKRGKPMTRQEIVDEVMRRRQVKVATIQLALTNKRRFQKDEGGRFVPAVAPIDPAAS